MRGLIPNKSGKTDTTNHLKTFYINSNKRHSKHITIRTSKSIYVHVTGFGALFAQGESMEKAKLEAVASKAICTAETRYPKNDLEAMSIDFALRRFQNYFTGVPNKVIQVTDHQLLCCIFNGKRKESIQSERITLRHQEDIAFKVKYQKGKINKADYLSIHAITLKSLPAEHQTEVKDMNKVLFLLHLAPLMESIGITIICEETKLDNIFKKVGEAIINGDISIMGNKASKFNHILRELSVSGNDLVLKGEWIVPAETIY